MQKKKKNEISMTYARSQRINLSIRKKIGRNRVRFLQIFRFDSDSLDDFLQQKTANGGF